MPGRDREQVEVVVAEHGNCRITEAHDFAQHRERSGPAIDEIADEPQAIARGREREKVEHLAELGVTALNVADCVMQQKPTR
jgi:hypothetical protein